MAKKKARRALGRGLTNLIPVDNEETGSGNEVMLVDVNAIHTNPYQPRTDFDQDEIDGLSESIRNQGLLQPIILRKKNDGYEIISGERRFRAMKKLGNDSVPAIVKAQISDHDMLEMALVENIQREDLNEIEKAYAYQRLLLECNLSHEKLSERVGKSRSAITNSLRLLKLPKEVQNYVRNGKLSMGHARALCALESSDEQKEVAQAILTDALSVRDVEKLTQEGDRRKDVKKAKKQPSSTGKNIDPDLKKVVEKLEYHFGTPVGIKTSPKKEKGKIEISFLGTDDLNRILDILF
ncbi:MAG: ParB/RepB/Spo0J family partition protein [Chitinivibrionales bacterium]|nr:ParB/RepB/Spo0J family partition protein [Chitinivibrionales bacterium]